MRGVPLRLEIGPRDIDNGVVMAVTRFGEKTQISRNNVVEQTADLLETFRLEMKQRAEARAMEQILQVSTMQEAKDAAETGVAVLHWCGDVTCAEIIEKETGVSVLGYEVRSTYVDEKEGRCLVCGKEARPAIISRTY